MATGESVAYGRDQAEWDLLAQVGEQFLIEHARLGRLTSYTEPNATLERRTGLRPFDFAMQADRAAMGHLLGLIVQERNRPITHLMISALVIYLDGNDAGSGFYKLAQDLGDLPPGALSSHMRDRFWTDQVKKLFNHYGGGSLTTSAGSEEVATQLRAATVKAPEAGQRQKHKEVRMPGSLKRIRGEMDVKPTPRDKGISLTLRVTAYDNGMVEVDGVPINAAPDYDAGHGWLGAAETALLTLSEFRRQAEQRRKQKAARA